MWRHFHTGTYGRDFFCSRGPLASFHIKPHQDGNYASSFTETHVISYEFKKHLLRQYKFLQIQIASRAIAQFMTCIRFSDIFSQHCTRRCICDRTSSLKLHLYLHLDPYPHHKRTRTPTFTLTRQPKNKPEKHESRYKERRRIRTIPRLGYMGKNSTTTLRYKFVLFRRKGCEPDMS